MMNFSAENYSYWHLFDLCTKHFSEKFSLFTWIWYCNCIKSKLKYINRILHSGFVFYFYFWKPTPAQRFLIVFFFRFIFTCMLRYAYFLWDSRQTGNHLQNVCLTPHDSEYSMSENVHLISIKNNNNSTNKKWFLLQDYLRKIFER